MKKRYIFFQGLIDTLDLYTSEFVTIFEEQGGECLVLNAVHMMEEMVRLKAFLLEPVTSVISFNNVGLHLELEDGKNIWDRFQIPFYNIMMDHPFHYKKALDAAPEQMILLCMDRNHVEYVQRFFQNIKNVKFFPHAGIELPVAASAGAAEMRTGRLPVYKRQIDVLYAGGLSRYAAEGLIPDLGRIVEFDAFSLVRRALERLIAEPQLTTEYVIEQCLRDEHLIFEDTKLGEIISELRFVDSFAVSFFREQAVRTLMEHGITVTVFGTGWDRVEWQHTGPGDLVYGGEIPPKQVLELMNRSRIVLNTMTWFKRGAHDRIFNGMLAGAAVVSDTSEYMQEYFTDGQELRLFDLKDINSLAEIVQTLLNDTDQAQRLADCGYQVSVEYHMWRNRLQELL